MRKLLLCLRCVVLLLLGACQPQLSFSSPLLEIELDGPLKRPEAQLSGLAWAGDWLILLPQYPDFAGDGAFVYGLPKQAILAYLAQAEPQPLTPEPIPVETNGLHIAWSQGFEAVAFAPQAGGGWTAVLLVEAAPWGRMRGYMLRGELAADRSQLRLQPEPLAELRPQSHELNMAYESLLLANGRFYAFYELNELRYNPNPRALVLDEDLQPLETAVLAPVPHRLTDVTEVDENGRFWAISYRGINWQQHLPTVEQLVELQLDGNQIRQTKTPPINLNGRGGRNWEGIVQLNERGFLLVTDQHPRTMLAFAARVSPH